MYSTYIFLFIQKSKHDHGGLLWLQYNHILLAITMCCLLLTFLVSVTEIIIFYEWFCHYDVQHALYSHKTLLALSAVSSKQPHVLPSLLAVNYPEVNSSLPPLPTPTTPAWLSVKAVTDGWGSPLRPVWDAGIGEAQATIDPELWSSQQGCVKPEPSRSESKCPPGGRGGYL